MSWLEGQSGASVVRMCLRHWHRARVCQWASVDVYRLKSSATARPGCYRAVRYQCQCVNALPECVAARRLRVIRCRVGRPWLRGLQCTHGRIRWHPTNGLEQELWLTRLWHDVCATKPARPVPTRPSSMLSDAKSRPHGLHPCSRLGRRTPRSGTLPVHDLH